MNLTATCVSWTVRDRVIVDGVSIEARPGSMVGLLGPNGSGKSSLLRLLAGLRAPSAGVIRLGDDDLASLRRRHIAQRVGVVEQESATDTDPLVRDVIELGRIPHRRSWQPAGRQDVEAVHRAAAATGVLDRLEQPYSTLSGGERQRVQIARALAQEPEVLLLDEPTNHLDVRHQLDVLRLVRDAEITAIAALHDLNLAAAYCDEIVVLANGRVVSAGPPAAVITEELVAEVYGVKAFVEPHRVTGALTVVWQP